MAMTRAPANWAASPIHRARCYNTEFLDWVVLKSLAKSRDDRYEDAAHMRQDLLAAVQGTAVLAPAVDTWTAQTTVLAPAAAPSPAPAPAPAPAPVPPFAESEEEPKEQKRSSRWWVWALVVLPEFMYQQGQYQLIDYTLDGHTYPGGIIIIKSIWHSVDATRLANKLLPKHLVHLVQNCHRLHPPFIFIFHQQV